jgi:hypothetical protein
MPKTIVICSDGTGNSDAGVPSNVRRLFDLIVQDGPMQMAKYDKGVGTALKQYFPQALEWCKDKDTMVFCDFLSRWPTLKQAKHARQATLEAFFREHNVRYPHIIEERPQAIKTATPFDRGPRRRRIDSSFKPSSNSCA